MYIEDPILELRLNLLFLRVEAENVLRMLLKFYMIHLRATALKIFQTLYRLDVMEVIWNSYKYELQIITN